MKWKNNLKQITIPSCIAVIILLNWTGVLSAKTVKYEWNSLDSQWKLSINFSDEFYEVYSHRTRYRDYDLFATDSFDDEIIAQIIKYFKQALKTDYIDRNDILKFVIAFVQSLDYIDDYSATGMNEYPKFPYETLYDAKGDCEDTAILLAALLLGLEQDVILLEFENHLATAVALPKNEHDGYYVTHNEKTYFYIETTDNNWGIGELPDLYKEETVTILDLQRRPSFYLSSSNSYSYDSSTIELEAIVKIHNLGSITSQNTKIEVTVVDNENFIQAETKSRSFLLAEEEEIEYSLPKLEFPYTYPFKLYIIVYSSGNPINQLEGNWQFLELEK